MTASIIIPAYNEEKYLPKTIEAILKYKTSSLLEILVVDNNSTDGTAVAASRFSLVRVLKETNKGPNWARQRGLCLFL